MLSLSIAVVTWAANAFADSPNLMGAYGFTRTVRCIVSETRFTKDTHRAETPYFGESFAEEGVATFNGDGKGTQSFTALNIEIPGAHSGANSSHVKDQGFAYVVGDDGKWSIQGGGSITGTVDDGPRAGDTFTINNIASPVGHISTNAATLTLSTVGPPVIETIDYVTSLGVPDGTLFRICNRSTVFISLPPGQ
jgi:hypothetical protein